MSQSHDNTPTPLPAKLLLPWYWPLWLALGLLWLVAQLPYRAQLTVGRMLGAVLFAVAPRRRGIARINLDLCFPELAPSQRARLLRDHFHSLGMSIVEAAMAWWTPADRLRVLAKASGAHYVTEQLDRGHGVVVLGGHYTTLEISGALVALATPVRFNLVYRPHENALIEWMFQRFRHRHAMRAIPREDVKTMARVLRNGEVVWLAADQNFGLKNSLFSPFFGVPAATNTATSRLARLGHAVVVPYVSRRLPRTAGYEIAFLPALEDFPSDDVQRDTDRVNLTIEHQVRRAPEQYLWIHRRFKDRPPGEQRFY